MRAEKLDAAIADPRHQRDPHDRPDDDRRFGFAEFAEAEELERVDGRDVRQRSHHDHVGEEDRPPVHPARHRAERARDPRERRARVGVGAVEVFVGRGDQQHRDECHEHYRRGVHTDAFDRHDKPERRRQRVGRRRRGDADDDVREIADRALLQTLVHHPGLFGRSPRCGCADSGHWDSSRKVVTNATSSTGASAMGAIPKTYGLRCTSCITTSGLVEREMP